MIHSRISPVIGLMKVKQYLVEKGVESYKIRVEGHRADDPATEMKTPLSLAKNRRVEFKVR